MTALLVATALPAKTLIVNANGYTLDTNGELVRFTGLLVGDDGKVAALYGKDDKPAKLAQGDFKLDAGGKTLLPGLIDAHAHVMGLGYQALTVDLSGTRSLDEALAKVRDYAAANRTARWILGRGWNQVTWNLGRFPTAADLDRAVADRPVALERVDGHATWVNSAALKAAAIGRTTKDPAGGRIERLPGGAPAGVLVDAASALVAKVVPPPSGLQDEAALAKALQLMAAAGLTGVHDAGIDARTWNLYRRFGDEGRLSARIYAMAGGMDALDAIAPVKPVSPLYGDRLELRSVKLYADGALGSRGAALAAPYSDDPGNKGLRFIDDARLQNWISRASFAGFQVAVHAIGDAANAQALDAFQLTAPTYGTDRRHRIEHAQVIDPADIPRFARFGVIASVQPTHATSDKAMAGDRVGEARLEGAYAWRALLGSGARLAGGSDFPVEPVDPFFGLHAAVTRQDRADQPPGGWRADQALTRTEALAAFTTGAAYAGFAEDRTGSLTPGHWADFILVDRDYFTVPPEQIWRTQVLETWLAGRRVYVRPAETPSAPVPSPTSSVPAAPRR
jgi:hypothetical protein